MEFYNEAVAVWFKFYEGKFGIKPTMNARAGGDLKAILKALKMKCEEKRSDFVWGVDIMELAFSHFLYTAYNDRWLRDNFLLSNLNKQFDAIVAKARKLSGANNNLEGFSEALEKWKNQ